MPHSELYHAIMQHDCNRVNHLIDDGADINQPRPYPLHVAVIKESQPIVEALIHRGANVNSADRSGNTALHMAAGKSRCNVLKILLAHGAEIEAKDKYGNTPLHIASTLGRLKALDSLLAAGANVAVRNVAGATPSDVATPRARELLAQRATQTDTTSPNPHTRFAAKEIGRKIDRNPPTRS